MAPNGVKVDNLSSNWHDGLALNALLNRDGFDEAKMRSDSPSRVELALAAATRRDLPCVLGVDELLDVDEISLMTFLAQIYLTNRHPSAAAATMSTAAAAPAASDAASTTTQLLVRPSGSSKHALNDAASYPKVLATAVVTNDYFADADDELSLLTGDKLELLAQVDDQQWCVGRKCDTARIGNVARQYIELDKQSQQSLSTSTSDVELVMSQADCTREQAVAALQRCNNDVVNAIMSLTL